MIKIGKNISEFSTYSCKPKTKDELKKIIKSRISKYGYECDLNDIDTRLITDMNSLFYQSKFNGDISDWDVSKVENMGFMFYSAKFNGDISDWDVSNVTNMQRMFQDSKFNHDISNWKINRACNITDIFHRCQIKKEYKPVLPE